MRSQQNWPPWSECISPGQPKWAIRLVKIWTATPMACLDTRISAMSYLLYDCIVRVTNIGKVKRAHNVYCSILSNGAPDKRCEIKIFCWSIAAGVTLWTPQLYILQHFWPKAPHLDSSHSICTPAWQNRVETCRVLKKSSHSEVGTTYWREGRQSLCGTGYHPVRSFVPIWSRGSVTGE